MNVLKVHSPNTDDLRLESSSVGLSTSLTLDARRRGIGFPHPASKPTKISLPTLEGFCFEKIKHIVFMEAQGNYTNLHFTDGRKLLVCRTLRELEVQLSKNENFVRIHRSHTVHLRHVVRYIRGKGGMVVLQNGQTLAVSAGQREIFLEAISRFFS